MILDAGFTVRQLFFLFINLKVRCAFLIGSAYYDNKALSLANSSPLTFSN